jgi:uncharacterized protein YbaR (Trm112 family)
MPIDKELLDILACPKCKGNLILTKSQDGLICNACALKYHIKDDIPIMLIDKAEKIEVKKTPPAKKAKTKKTATKKTATKKTATKKTPAAKKPTKKASTKKKAGAKKTGPAKKKTKKKE